MWPARGFRAVQPRGRFPYERSSIPHTRALESKLTELGVPEQSLSFVAMWIKRGQRAGITPWVRPIISNHCQRRHDVRSDICCGLVGSGHAMTRLVGVFIIVEQMTRSEGTRGRAMGVTTVWRG